MLWYGFWSVDGYGVPYTLTPAVGKREYPDNAKRAESYWHEQTVWPETGSVIIRRPFSQQVDWIGAAAAFDVCDWAPGLIAPLWTPVTDPQPGLIDGTFVVLPLAGFEVAAIVFCGAGDALAVVVCPLSNCK